MRFFIRFLTAIGHVIVQMSTRAGQFTIFTCNSLSYVVRPPFFFKLFLTQIMRIGYYSLPVIALTSFFTGAVFALQIYYAGTNFNAETIIATIVALGMTSELGPVFAGLLVAGRMASAIAAELGSMRVTDQIDALTTLATNPYKYLIVPRLLAAILTMPVLVLVADVIGIMGGFMVSTQALGFNEGVYIKATMDFLTLEMVRSGMIKAMVFGFIIALIGSFHGFHSRGGAQGVGNAATNAVVASSVLILASNYVLTSVFFSG